MISSISGAEKFSGDENDDEELVAIENLPASHHEDR